MSKIGIVYATKTKHSKKIAEAIGLKLNVKAENVKSHPVFEDTALLFIIGGIYAGKSSPELLEFLGKLDKPAVNKAVIISSAASPTHTQESVKIILEEKGIQLVDEIFCQGSFLFVNMGRPNKTDIQETVNSALNSLEKVYISV